MSKPAFFVEGKTEQRIVQTLCPGCPVRIINCNGDGVSLEAISKRVGTLARLLHEKYRPLVVIFDREGRDATVTDIKTALLGLLKAEGIETDTILGVPDRMLENWILADFETFCRLANVERTLFNPATEGTAGAAALKKLLPTGVPYVKTIHGVEWFIASNPEVMKQNSASFRQFGDEMKPLSCRWLSQGRLL